MIMNKTENPQNSGYQPKTMNNSKQHFAGNGRFSYTRSHIETANICFKSQLLLYFLIQITFIIQTVSHFSLHRQTPMQLGNQSVHSKMADN